VVFIYLFRQLYFSDSVKKKDCIL